MIWLIGCEGMLGRELGLALGAAGMDWIGSDREVDIRSPEALAAFAAGKAIRWIVNCAAYTAVDRAEDEAELARALNAQAPGNIARLAAELGAAMLHLSTDYVFDGSATSPYEEDAPVSPVGVYGRTKAAGEAAVRDNCPRHVILRTAWLYGKHGPNFVHTMLRLMMERERIGVVADQVGTPTWARDLAAAIVAILGAPKTIFGTFHFTNLGETSWYEFALAIFRLARKFGILERDCAVEPLATAQYPTAATRPAWSVLSKDRIVAAYGLTIPRWEESLEFHLVDIAAIRRRQKT